MPIFEFVCPKCKSEIEVIQSHKDSNPKCDKCDCDMNKIISQTFNRKGGGLYSLDTPQPNKLGNVK